MAFWRVSLYYATSVYTSICVQMFTAAVHLRLHCTERRRHSLSASKSRELPKLFTGLSKSINHELNTQKNQFPDPQQECCISVCVHNGPGWLLRITHKTSLQNCQCWEMSSLCYLTSTLSIYGFQTSMPVSKLWRSLFRTFNQTLQWKRLRLYHTSSTCW